AGNAYGPSRYPAATSAAPAIANPEEASTTTGQSQLPSARVRCGTAEPMVSAPTSAPMARPRSARNHVAAIFIAGGYTPARSTPVRKRKRSPAPGVGAQTTAALTTAAASDVATNNRRAGLMSARFSSALPAAPVTNPSCTAMVSHAAPAGPRPQASTNCEATAVALNQRVIPSSSASASSPRTPHRDRAPSPPRADPPTPARGLSVPSPRTPP